MLVIMLVKFFQKRYCTSLHLNYEKVKLKVQQIVCKFAGFEVFKSMSKIKVLNYVTPNFQFLNCVFFLHFIFVVALPTSLSYKYY